MMYSAHEGNSLVLSVEQVEKENGWIIAFTALDSEPYSVAYRIKICAGTRGNRRYLCIHTTPASH